MTITSTLRGVNLVGGEFNWASNIVPKEGQNYLFVSDTDITYLVGKGMKFARLVFSWELLQPTLKGPLVTTPGSYGATLLSRVAKLRSLNVHVMIEPHSADTSKSAKYKGMLVGSVGCPNDAFSDLWMKISSLFVNDPYGVSFGLSNEPNNMSTTQWFQAAQEAILGIRSTGARNRIMCPGNGWSGAASWSSNWYDTSPFKKSNAVAWLENINDPLNNTLVSVHCYFDTDRSGSTNGILDVNVVPTDLANVVAFARAHGLKIHVGEFGASSTNALAQQAVTNFLDYVDNNRDVIEGWAWWAYGPPAWWGKNLLTLCPSNNYTIDSPMMSWLSSRFSPPPTPVLPKQPNLLASTNVSSPPASDSSKTFSVKVLGIVDVPDGTYKFLVRTRTLQSSPLRDTIVITIDNLSTIIDATAQYVQVDIGSRKVNSNSISLLSSTNDTGLITLRLSPALGKMGPMCRVGIILTLDKIDTLSSQSVSVKTLTLL